MINFLPLEDLTKSKLETNSSEPKMIAAKLLVTPVFVMLAYQQDMLSSYKLVLQ